MNSTAASKIEETFDNSKQILSYVKHLEKLDALVEIKDHILNAATGKDHIQKDVAILLFKILGLVIVSLTAIIAFLLTGSHFGVIGSLH